VEWLALVLLVGLVLAMLAWVAGLRLPGALLVKSIAARIVCAVRLTEDCLNEPELRAASGPEVAALLRAHAPALLYERGMTALPVDYRRCRTDACAAGPEEGAVTRSLLGQRVVAFTHAIDCRPGAARASEAAGMDCSGPRGGNLYLQYWLYYPGSATGEGSTPLRRPIRAVSDKLGHPSFHLDDWESYQVRIGPAGRFARASAHHGYSYGPSGGFVGYRAAPGPDGRLRIRRIPEVVNGWGPETETLYVSGGSHAGRARSGRPVSRSTKDHRLELIPIETLAGRESAPFAVSPPWHKRVYLDPEYAGTD
jgi:hypothetical protein